MWGGHSWLDEGQVAYYATKTAREYEYEWICLDEDIDVVEEIHQSLYVIYSFNKNVDYKTIIKDYIKKEKELRLQRLTELEEKLLSLEEK